MQTSQATQSGWSAWRQPRSTHGERELDRCFLVASGGSEDSPVSWVPPRPPLLWCPLDPVQPRTRLGNQLAGLVITFASLSPQHWLVPPSPPPTLPVGFLSCSLASYVECRLLSLFLFCFVLFCSQMHLSLGIFPTCGAHLIKFDSWGFYCELFLNRLISTLMSSLIV